MAHKSPNQLNSSLKVLIGLYYNIFLNFATQHCLFFWRLWYLILGLYSFQMYLKLSFVPFLKLFRASGRDWKRCSNLCNIFILIDSVCEPKFWSSYPSNLLKSLVTCFGENGKHNVHLKEQTSSATEKSEGPSMGIEYCHKSHAPTETRVRRKTSMHFFPEGFPKHSWAIFYPASLPPGAILWPARRKTAQACTDSARETLLSSLGKLSPCSREWFFFSGRFFCQ